MELYKFISETEIKKYKGGFVVIDNRIYTNPTEETVRKAGYKELAESEVPTMDYDTECLMITYADGDVITPVYEIVEISAEIQ